MTPRCFAKILLVGVALGLVAAAPPAQKPKKKLIRLDEGCPSGRVERPNVLVIGKRAPRPGDAAAREELLAAAKAAAGKKREAGAWFELAEHDFFTVSPDSLPKAADEYARAISASPGAFLREVARFRLVWTLFRLDEWDRSAKEAAALLGEKGGPGLRAEAMRFLALDLVEPDTASFEAQNAFFARAGHPAWEVEAWQAIAEIELEQTRYGDAEAVFRHLLALAPDSAPAARWQGSIVRTREGQRDLARAEEERKVLEARYGTQAAWAKRHPDAPAFLEQARKLAGPKKGWEEEPQVCSGDRFKQLGLLAERMRSCAPNGAGAEMLAVALKVAKGGKVVSAQAEEAPGSKRLACVVEAARNATLQETEDDCSLRVVPLFLPEP